MRQHLQEKLFNEFKFLKKGRTPSEWFFWGIECDDGWYDLLYDLLNEIRKLNCDIKIHQIKEKFGELRFYYSCDHNFDKKINELVDKAEDDSFTICEVCGKPGKIEKIGWLLKCVCNEHYKELGEDLNE